ncbi:hypothetical protein SCLCIDRAFT_1219898 [Scleroderma citrinum Foug A]|uniref:Uncharacterized protein n=1 Tax=Scleroderma citrinum Foug A TaxID=1036808 RepID=A0A0C3DKN2_9AGAM|nr:hypothetical protein SCLCIDRAFT_1219898 [Scleroderma citrinum Foug A]
MAATQVGDASTSGTVASAAVPTAKVPLQQNRSAVSGSEKAGEVIHSCLSEFCMNRLSV